MAGEVLQLQQEGPLPVGEQLQQHRVRVQAQRHAHADVGQQGAVCVREGWGAEMDQDQAQGEELNSGNLFSLPVDEKMLALHTSCQPTTISRVSRVLFS